MVARELAHKVGGEIRDFFCHGILMRPALAAVYKHDLHPDLVKLIQFREMLGGIADSTARKLMRENRVKHYYIRTTYLIPKEWVIDYLLSTHYAKYRQKLKVHV